MLQSSPSCGFWTKLAAGKTVALTPLPRRGMGMSREIYQDSFHLMTAVAILQTAVGSTQLAHVLVEKSAFSEGSNFELP